jgi:hypothetical protein
MFPQNSFFLRESTWDPRRCARRLHSTSFFSSLILYNVRWRHCYNFNSFLVYDLLLQSALLKDSLFYYVNAFHREGDVDLYCGGRERGSERERERVVHTHTHTSERLDSLVFVTVLLLLLSDDPERTLCVHKKKIRVTFQSALSNYFLSCF